MNEQIREQRRGHLLAFGALAIVLSFVTGYYWSRYTLAEDFLQLCLQEELADRIAAAFYMREGGQEEEGEREQENVHAEIEGTEVEGESPAGSDDATQREGEAIFQETGSLEGSRRLYQAVLIGFGEKRSAERYIVKLASSGIEAHVVKRTGKNRRGREVTWYQVVTAAMTYDDITSVIMQLKKTDRLEGVMIVEAEVAQKTAHQT